jgi:hypothetical protein
VNDSAFLDRLLACASPAQRGQLRPKLQQFIYTGVHMANVFINQRIHSSTAGGRTVGGLEQQTNFVVRHVQCAAVPNETQAVGVALVIAPVVRFRPVRLRKQPFLFIESDCVGRAVGQSREFTDFHDFLLSTLTLELLQGVYFTINQG